MLRLSTSTFTLGLRQIGRLLLAVEFAPRPKRLGINVFGDFMDSKNARFDKAYLAIKREQLTKLRRQLSDSVRTGTAEERSVNSESAGQAREYEDDAQRLASLELDGTLVGRDVRRLARIERALQKIEDGTYGISDESGALIPADRLEVMPEATCVLSEQEKRDYQSMIPAGTVGKR